jgi:hypothetical protein
MSKTYESDEPCICCGLQGEGLVTYHHIFTRKVYPEFAEEKWNQIPVCRLHHGPGNGVGFHDHGTAWMANKFPSVKKWLEEKGWFYCEYVKKYRRENF